VRFDVARHEAALAPLVGLPLWRATRAANMLCLQFGTRLEGVSRFGPHKGTATTHGEYALHVQCAWRIAGPEGVVVAKSDLWHPHSALLREGWDWSEDETWNPMDHDANRWDERIKPWTARSYVLQAATADSLGGVRLALEDGFVLEVFPDWSHDGEYWRVFAPDDSRPHFVVTG